MNTRGPNPRYLTHARPGLIQYYNTEPRPRLSSLCSLSLQTLIRPKDDINLKAIHSSIMLKWCRAAEQPQAGAALFIHPLAINISYNGGTEPSHSRNSNVANGGPGPRPGKAPPNYHNIFQKPANNVGSPISFPGWDVAVRPFSWILGKS